MRDLPGRSQEKSAQGPTGAGGLHAGEEQPVGHVCSAVCVCHLKGSTCSASLEKQLTHSALSFHFFIPHRPCCLQKSVPAKSPSEQIGKKKALPLSFLALVVVGFL